MRHSSWSTSASVLVHGSSLVLKGTINVQLEWNIVGSLGSTSISGINVWHWAAGTVILVEGTSSASGRTLSTSFSIPELISVRTPLIITSELEVISFAGIVHWGSIRVDWSSIQLVMAAQTSSGITKFASIWAFDTASRAVVVLSVVTTLIKSSSSTISLIVFEIPHQFLEACTLQLLSNDGSSDWQIKQSSRHLSHKSALDEPAL